MQKKGEHAGKNSGSIFSGNELAKKKSVTQFILQKDGKLRKEIQYSKNKNSFIFNSQDFWAQILVLITWFRTFQTVLETVSHASNIHIGLFTKILLEPGEKSYQKTWRTTGRNIRIRGFYLEKSVEKTSQINIKTIKSFKMPILRFKMLINSSSSF